MKKIQLETAPIVPVSECRRVLNMTPTQEKQLRAQGAFCPETRGNGREYASFVEITRASRVLSRN